MKYGTPEYYLNESKKEIDKALEKISHTRKEIGEIKPIQKCSKISTSTLSQIYNINSVGRFDQKVRKKVEKAYEVALKIYEEKIQEIEKIHEDNLENIENNEKLIESIHDFMETIGIKKEYSTFEKPSNRHKNEKWIKRTAGYVGDITRNIPVSDGYKMAIRSCEDFKKYRTEEYNKFIQEIEQQEKEKLKEEKERENIKELARFQVKYNSEGEWEDILQKIIYKDKYLYLAHYLLMNREDWTDGHHYADIGLIPFENSENEEDDRIYSEIRELIDNWENDGRVFRDCNHNYTNLFGLVKDKELIKDYEIVKQKIS